jgi:Ribosomal protein L1
MRKRSKRYKNLLESLKKKEYKNLDQIIKELKNGSGVKFVESIDLSLKINLKKIKGAENSLRTLVELPHGNGKKIKVAVLCDENKLKDAKKSGAEVIGSDDLLKKISDKDINLTN